MPKQNLTGAFVGYVCNNRTFVRYFDVDSSPTNFGTKILSILKNYQPINIDKIPQIINHIMKVGPIVRNYYSCPHDILAHGVDSGTWEVIPEIMKQFNNTSKLGIIGKTLQDHPVFFGWMYLINNDRGTFEIWKGTSGKVYNPFWRGNYCNLSFVKSYPLKNLPDFDKFLWDTYSEYLKFRIVWNRPDTNPKTKTVNAEGIRHLNFTDTIIKKIKSLGVKERLKIRPPNSQLKITVTRIR